MPREIFLDQLADAQEAVQAAVAALEAGQLVLLPDECGWNLAGLSTRESAVSALAAAAKDNSGQAAVSLAHPGMVADFVTNPSRLFQKLSVRCWPGPVVLRGDRDAQDHNGLINQWPPSARSWGATERGRAFYCPADPFTQEVLQGVSAPVLSLLGGPSPLKSLTEGAEPSLIVHSAQARFTAPQTVVAVDGGRLTLERSGVVSERMLARLAGEVYLFVCTGNTCRSPMAEALFRKLLADFLQCRDDELIDQGYVVLSAGLAAYKGAPASPEAVELLGQDGVDLGAHESQPVTEELLLHCDHIFTMTRSHRDAVLSAYPELASQVRLLSPEAEDVPDPIGAGRDEYLRCRNMISHCLEHLLAEIEDNERKGNGA